jgi:hypothetical protein
METNKKYLLIWHIKIKEVLFYLRLCVKICFSLNIIPMKA